jgi:hypothetical protein
MQQGKLAPAFTPLGYLSRQAGMDPCVWERRFTFDHCFWSSDNSGLLHAESASDARCSPFASQETVFDIVGEPLLESVFDGFNASIFAYGQTGVRHTRGYALQQHVLVCDA